MNKQKVFGLVLMLLGIVCIGLSICVNYSSKEENDTNNKEDDNVFLTHREEVESNIKNIFLSTNTTSKKINSIIGDSIMINNYIVLGEDSYLRSVPDTEEDLTKYKGKQDIYAEKVETKYLNNTSYTIEEYGENLLFKIKPWYFALYSSDLQSLTLKLMIMAGVDLNLVETNYNEYSVYEYKARIKSLIILDEYLDDYDNQDEILEFVFYYDGDVPSDNQYYSLYLNLVGVFSDSVENDTNKEERVNTYLNTAISNGLVDEKNPLGI